MKPMSPARIRIYHWIPQVLKTVFICSEMEGDSVRCWASRRSCFVTISANHAFRVQSRGCSLANPHAQWAQHPNCGSEVRRIERFEPNSFSPRKEPAEREMERRPHVTLGSRHRSAHGICCREIV